MKLVLKLTLLVAMVLLMGSALRYGGRYVMQAAGMPAPETPQFSSEETDLMTTVFTSALRLFSGTAKRSELASDLSDKLYAGRAGAGEMSELGIELVKPGTSPAPPEAGASGAKAPPGAKLPLTPTAASRPAKPHTPAGGSPAERLAGSVRTDLLARF